MNGPFSPLDGARGSLSCEVGHHRNELKVKNNATHKTVLSMFSYRNVILSGL